MIEFLIVLNLLFSGDEGRRKIIFSKKILEKIIDNHSKELLKEKFDYKIFINIFNGIQSYKIWELDEVEKTLKVKLEDFFEGISQENLNEIIKMIIKIIYKLSQNKLHITIK